MRSRKTLEQKLVDGTIGLFGDSARKKKDESPLGQDRPDQTHRGIL